jgi:hypothetical protein
MPGTEAAPTAPLTTLSGAHTLNAQIPTATKIRVLAPMIFSLDTHPIPTAGATSDDSITSQRVAFLKVDFSALTEFGKCRMGSRRNISE